MKRAPIVIAVLLLAAPLMAQTAGPPPGSPQATVIRFLQLSEDQVATWHDLATAREEAAAPIREALGAVHDQLAELFAQEDPDPAAVGSLVLERRSLEAELVEIQRAYVEGFEAMLDEEQAGKLGAVRKAAALEPVVPAFRKVGLVRPR